MNLKLSKRRVKEIITPIVLIYVLLHVFIFANQSRFLYAPDNSRVTPASAGVPEMQAIAVNPVDMSQSIEGWYKAAVDTSKPTIIIFHGDGGGIRDQAIVASALTKKGYGVVLAEYRGFSTNPGKPSEAGLYADGEAYINWLINHEGIAENRIILYGQSLGTGVATTLATRHLNIAGLILDGSFTSLTALNKRSLPGIMVSVVLSDHYNNLSRIANVTCPILFIHGQKDNVVPVAMAQKLYNAANQPKTIKIYPNAGHTNLYRTASTDVNAFIASVQQEP